MKTLNKQLEIAIELAIKYHKGQIDKGGIHIFYIP